MAASRQLLRKILSPVPPWNQLLYTVLVKNEYCELRLEINEEEQWIVVSKFLHVLTNLFDAAMIVL